MLSREKQRALRDTLFRHLDGIVTAPTAHALSRAGVLDFMVEAETASLPALVSRFSANEGYLNVALRTLASQGWLEQHLDNATDEISYRLTDVGRIAFAHAHLYADVVALTRSSENFHPRKFQVEPFRMMESVFQDFTRGFGIERSTDPVVRNVQEQIFTHIEGALLGPTIVHLGMTGMFHKYFMEASFRAEEFHEDAENFGRLLAMFVTQGWFTETNGTFQFTDEGLFFARRASAYGVTVSYSPTLRHLDELLFGDPDFLRSKHARDPEKQVDREMNVWGSGGAHSAYFRTIDEIVIDMFNGPIDEQPRGIVDMGCGNGAFLEHLFNVIAKQTRRGQMLDDHPLFLVGVDFNETALKVTRSNLARADIWAKVIWGDIGRPDQLAHDLITDYGIDLRDLLNARTFLDHNRTWVEPPDISERVSVSTGAFASRGDRVSNNAVEESLLAHLKKWSPYIQRFGLLLIELHTIAPRLAAANLGRTAATAYDATHGYSDQYIVEAEVFGRIAAEAGLTSRSAYVRKFPDSDLATVTVQWLEATTDSGQASNDSQRSARKRANRRSAKST